MASMQTVVRLVLLALMFAGAARANDIAWPLQPCTASEIATASPAPMLSDSRSLAEVPFLLSLSPVAAGYVVSLDKDNHPIIRCATYDSSLYLLYPGTVAVAGLVFSTPRQPNEAIPGGRYLVRLYDTLGIGMVSRPPSAPMLPPCMSTAGGPPVLAQAGASRAAHLSRRRADRRH